MFLFSALASGGILGFGSDFGFAWWDYDEMGIGGVGSANNLPGESTLYQLFSYGGGGDIS